MARPSTAYGPQERRSPIPTFWRPKTGIELDDNIHDYHDQPYPQKSAGHYEAFDLLGRRKSTPLRHEKNMSMAEASGTAHSVNPPRQYDMKPPQETRERRPSIYGSSSTEVWSLGRSTARRVGRLSALFTHKSKEKHAIEEEQIEAHEAETPSSKWLRRAKSTTLRFGRRHVHGQDQSEILTSPTTRVAESSMRGSAFEAGTIRGGEAARAAAAASSKVRLESLQPPSLREFSKLKELDANADSESGIGIDMKDLTDENLVAVSAVPRLDPAILPPELFEHIFTYLDSASVMNAELVSRKWLETASSYRVWRDIFGGEFNRRRSISRQIPRHVGGYGLGTNVKKQDWKQMWRVRKALDARWRDGHAAAIYLEGHKDSVYCVQFDEDKIITGSRDRTIRIWDARTYRCLKVLGIPKSGAIHSFTQPIGSRMIKQKPFKSISPRRSWLDLNLKAFPRSINHHGSILCLQFDSTTMVTGSSDTTLIIWDITKDYRPVHRLQCHTAGVLDVCFDDKHIVSCSKDTTICLWERSTGALLRTFTGHRGPVNAVQLRGEHIVSASGDAFARLWNITSGNCIKEFASKDRGLACVEFSPDSRTILVGGNDMVIYQFDANTGELVRELIGHQGLVRSLHLDSVNNRVISGSYDYSVKAFDARDGKLLCDFVGWTTSWMLSAKADYRRIVATSQDGRAVIMDFGHGLQGIELLES